MSVYRLIRALHLYTAMVLTVFVLMYFVSGYVMVHEETLGSGKPVQVVRELTLPTPTVSTPQELAASIEKQLELHGRRLPPRHHDDGSWELTYSRPGVMQRAVMRPGGQVVVTETKQGLSGMLNGFHRLHGYDGGALYVVWSVLYDLASASMILFAVSGIYLWYKLTRRRALGWVLIAVSFCYACGTIVYLICAA